MYSKLSAGIGKNMNTNLINHSNLFSTPTNQDIGQDQTQQIQDSHINTSSLSSVGDYDKFDNHLSKKPAFQSEFAKSLQNSNHAEMPKNSEDLSKISSEKNISNYPNIQQPVTDSEMTYVPELIRSDVIKEKLIPMKPVFSEQAANSNPLFSTPLISKSVNKYSSQPEHVTAKNLKHKINPYEISRKSDHAKHAEKLESDIEYEVLKNRYKNLKNFTKKVYPKEEELKNLRAEIDQLDTNIDKLKSGLKNDNKTQSYKRSVSALAIKRSEKRKASESDLNTSASWGGKLKNARLDNNLSKIADINKKTKIRKVGQLTNASSQPEIEHLNWKALKYIPHHSNPLKRKTSPTIGKYDSKVKTKKLKVRGKDDVGSRKKRFVNFAD